MCRKTFHVGHNSANRNIRRRKSEEYNLPPQRHDSTIRPWFDHPGMFFRRLAPTLGKVCQAWSRRRLVALLAGLLVISNAALHVMKHLRPETGTKISSHILMHSSELLVISLPNRQDRRRDMETLRMSLGLRWGYVDALSSDSPLVSIILGWVAAGRSSAPPALEGVNASNFSWPDDLEAIATSSEDISLWVDGNSPWDLVASGFPLSRPYPPIVCATKDYTIATGLLPEHMILTPARVACWHSHLAVIQKLANNFRPHGSGAAMIFEDDVDMEKDIDQQTHALWRTLPADWDIVFLGERCTTRNTGGTKHHPGHCWSDERRGIPLASPIVSATEFPPPSHSRLYASTNPKCTHAYALSRIGARRLLLHLRHPPFAYSRAIDQALAWLVESGRLKSFSAVPSLVVQRKISKSDVFSGNGTGSKWKETLSEGVLDCLQK